MEYLAKAAALVVSVLASVFTSVKAPEAKALPTFTPAAHQSQAPLAKSTTQCAIIIQSTEATVVVLPSVVEVDGMDLESARFLEALQSAPDPKRFIESKPWYMSTDLFSRPGAQQATDLLRALLSDDRVQ